MRRSARSAPSLEVLSVRELIIWIRLEPAKRDALDSAWPAPLKVGVAEARLIRELHHRFGVENITA